MDSSSAGHSGVLEASAGYHRQRHPVHFLRLVPQLHAATVDSHAEGCFSNWFSKGSSPATWPSRKRSPSRRMARRRSGRSSARPGSVAPRAGRFGRPRPRWKRCTVMGCPCDPRRICRGGTRRPRQRAASTTPTAGPESRQSRRRAFGQRQYPIERRLPVRGADFRHTFVVVWHTGALGAEGRSRVGQELE
jgi:hypothetical protein